MRGLRAAQNYKNLFKHKLPREHSYFVDFLIMYFVFPELFWSKK